MAWNFPGSCLCSVLGAGIFIAGCTILLITAFPIVQIALGASYLGECPAAPAVPVYVMVSGVWALLLMALFALPKLACPAWKGNLLWSLWLAGLVLLYLVWFLYGSYQIYSVYPPDYDKDATDKNSDIRLAAMTQNPGLPDHNRTGTTAGNQTSNTPIPALALSRTGNQTSAGAPGVPAAASYCNRTVYLFAFWTNTLVLVFAGHALMMIACLYGFMQVSHVITKYFTT